MTMAQISCASSTPPSVHMPNAGQTCLTLNCRSNLRNKWSKVFLGTWGMQHMIHYMPSDLSTVSLSLPIQIPATLRYTMNAYSNPLTNSNKLHHIRLKIYSRESLLDGVLCCMLVMPKRSAVNIEVSMFERVCHTRVDMSKSVLMRRC